MSTSSSDPAAPAHILPIGDRQLERIQPDQSLVVRVQPVEPAGAEVETRVVDLSLHGLLLESIPSLAQGALIDLIDLEPQPIRASVVRQSDLGTHVSFVDHLHPRYTRAKKNQPNRRRLARIPAEGSATVGPAVGTVLNASLGGVMVRVATPSQWSIGDRLTVTLDTHRQRLAGEVVGITDDRLSIRFTRVLPVLRIAAADCVITVEQRPAPARPVKAAKARPAAKAAKRPAAKAAKRPAAKAAKRPAAKAAKKPAAKPAKAKSAKAKAAKAKPVAKTAARKAPVKAKSKPKAKTKKRR
jgi:hypothetical protein